MNLSAILRQGLPVGTPLAPTAATPQPPLLHVEATRDRLPRSPFIRGQRNVTSRGTGDRDEAYKLCKAVNLIEVT